MGPRITMGPAKKTTKTEGPKYSELIKAALLGLKERNGSSLAAIKKYMASNFPAAKNDLALKNALKFGVSKGMFIKVKASFKLSPEAKKKTPVKKTIAKKKTKKKTVKKSTKPGAAKKKPATKKKPAAKKAPAPKKSPKKKAAKKSPKKKAAAKK